ncbi:hypothetical protein [Terriglobus sp.]|uniref:hypothetical protein n=1 Tax=Terriglobus sp. TaxID=1889013 RepID=UPI003B0099FC
MHQLTDFGVREANKTRWDTRSALTDLGIDGEDLMQFEAAKLAALFPAQMPDRIAEI